MRLWKFRRSSCKKKKKRREMCTYRLPVSSVRGSFKRPGKLRDQEGNSRRRFRFPSSKLGHTPWIVVTPNKGRKVSLHLIRSSYNDDCLRRSATAVRHCSPSKLLRKGHFGATSQDPPGIAGKSCNTRTGPYRISRDCDVCWSARGDEMCTSIEVRPSPIKAKRERERERKREE